MLGRTGRDTRAVTAAMDASSTGRLGNPGRRIDRCPGKVALPHQLSFGDSWHRGQSVAWGVYDQVTIPGSVRRMDNRRGNR